jgi:carbon-monoxide dehydrogenase medium subunit
MAPFTYVRPATVEAALEVLATSSASGRPAYRLAGGTALSILARRGFIEPGLLVDLVDLAPLAEIRLETDGRLRIGALATLRRVETDPRIRTVQPELARTAGLVASIRIRNQATIGGNLAHADPALDLPPLLIALDASVEVASVRGRRLIPAEAFVEGPFETALEPDELCTAIVVPPLPARSIVRYTKFLPRTADDWATASVAVRLDPGSDGPIDLARVVVGAAGPRPERVRAAEAELVGRSAAEIDPAAIGELVQAVVDPVDDVRGSADYKRAMVGLWAKRTLLCALEVAAREPQA